MTAVFQTRTPGLRGFSLTEAAIVLGIAGLVFAAIWTAAGTVSRKNSLRQASDSIVKIVQNTRLLYQERNDFPASSVGTDITNVLVRAGVFPAELFEASTPTIPRTPWGTEMNIQVTTRRSFTVELEPTLPDTTCLQLVSAMIGPGREPGLTALRIDGTLFENLQDVSIGNLSPCTTASFTFNLK